MVSEAIRTRYLRDPLPVRLGGLAADLARIASFSENPLNRDAVADLLEEGKFFAEWTAHDAPAPVLETLAEVQTSLALWHRHWLFGRQEPRLHEQASRWSDALIELSGLAA